MLEHRGHVADHDLAAARDAGLTDQELVEVIAEVSLSSFGNYVNRFTQPDYDIPRLPVDQAVAG